MIRHVGMRCIVLLLSISLWAKLALFILFPDLVEISIED